MSVLYETGTPAWDVGIILTRHGDGHNKTQHRDFTVCMRVVALRRTTGQNAASRLEQALAVPCTCGAGDSPAERTSLR